VHQTRSQSETAAPIPASLAGRPGQRFSDARRAEHPEAVRIRDPRAVELAGALARSPAAATAPPKSDLSVLGFSIGEIIAHLPEAKLILAESFVREIAPTGDRHAADHRKGDGLGGAHHAEDRRAGRASEEAAAVEWRRYCQARAAFKLDPWWSQSERCLAALKTFLRRLPLLEREANRVIYAVAAEQKATVHRGEHA
jgi:hypothetical protein